jgi:hypothetical protein
MHARKIRRGAWQTTYGEWNRGAGDGGNGSLRKECGQESARAWQTNVRRVDNLGHELSRPLQRQRHGSRGVSQQPDHILVMILANVDSANFDDAIIDEDTPGYALGRSRSWLDDTNPTTHTHTHTHTPSQIRISQHGTAQHSTAHRTTPHHTTAVPTNLTTGAMDGTERLDGLP